MGQLEGGSIGFGRIWWEMDEMMFLLVKIY